MMISGCSLTAYWVGNYLADILWQGLLALIAIASIHGFGLEIPKVELLFAVTVFANPPFLYFISFFFKKEDAGSLFVKLMHFVFGLIAPITLMILQFINEKTKKIYGTTKWMLYPFPIFSLIFGYIQIGNREILVWVYELEEEPEIYSEYVAGHNLYFLLGSVGVYWALVALCERKIFDLEKCMSNK
jgi:hypothetical protein